MKLTVCVLASEAAPFSKTGGLADVSAGLSKFLHSAGHDVKLFTPLYSSIDRRAHPMTAVKGLENLEIVVGTHRYPMNVLSSAMPGSGVPVLFVDCPALFARGVLYTTDPDEHLRFLAFTRAVFASCQHLKWAPRILHCNDWHTAFGPLLLKAAYSWDALFRDTRSVLTIHNIGYQGVFKAAFSADLALGDQAYLLHQDDLRAGRINPLRHGIMYAEALTTVSPTHAREICSDEFGMGLQDSLRARRDVLTGILNGVDYQEWDPRHDRYLPRHFDPETLPIKAQLKKQLLARLKLKVSPATPLAGMVSRLASQKGIELMFDSVPQVLDWRELAFVALGSGDAPYESFLAKLEADYPGRVVYRRGYDDELAHWIEGASDMFLMPSRYEPCGLNQMYSLRYGTVPVVRRTGGLADSVEPYDPQTGRGTGIVFNDFDSEALEWALNTGLDLYAEPRQWRRLVRNGMACDFSWQRQGALYVEVYERALA